MKCQEIDDDVPLSEAEIKRLWSPVKLKHSAILRTKVTLDRLFNKLNLLEGHESENTSAVIASLKIEAKRLVENFYMEQEIDGCSKILRLNPHLLESPQGLLDKAISAKEEEKEVDQGRGSF